MTALTIHLTFSYVPILCRCTKYSNIYPQAPYSLTIFKRIYIYIYQNFLVTTSTISLNFFSSKVQSCDHNRGKKSTDGWTKYVRDIIRLPCQIWHKHASTIQSGLIIIRVWSAPKKNIDFGKKMRQQKNPAQEFKQLLMFTLGTYQWNVVWFF